MANASRSAYVPEVEAAPVDLGQVFERNGEGPATAFASERLVDAAAVRTRKARVRDIQAIRDIVDPLVAAGRIAPVKPVHLYTSLQRFRVAERAGVVIGCGALYVVWESLAEVRTVAVRHDVLGTGGGGKLLSNLLHEAHELGMRRVFCLTFETTFFARHGFLPIEVQAVSPEVYREILHHYDNDVAHSLDLASIKPNTLGNTCMLLTLDSDDPSERSVAGSS